MTTRLTVQLSIEPSNNIVRRMARARLDPADPPDVLDDRGTPYQSVVVDMLPQDGGDRFEHTFEAPADGIEDGRLEVHFSASPRSAWSLRILLNDKLLLPEQRGKMKERHERWVALLPAPAEQG